MTIHINTPTDVTLVYIALAYFTVGLLCGIVGSWDVVKARRGQFPKPAVDIAVGIVAVVIAIFWPFWLFGWMMFNSYFVRWYTIKENYREDTKGWLRVVDAALGVGFILTVGFILWLGFGK